MKIQDIRAILAIAEHGSLSVAAQNLYISQPALSQILQKVEAELGTPLFIRQSGRSLQLTQDGHAYIAMAKQLLPCYDHFLEELSVAHQSKKASLKIGVPPRQGHVILDTLLAQKNHLPKGVSLEFKENSSSDLENMVVNQELDFAILRLPLKINNLPYRVIASEPLGILLPSDSPLIAYAHATPDFAYPSLPLDCLKNETFLLPPAPTRLRSTIDAILAEQRFIPSSIKTYESMRSIRTMVKNGLGCTICPVPDPQSENTAFFLIEKCTVFYCLALVYREDPNSALIAQKIARLLSQHLDHSLKISR